MTYAWAQPRTDMHEVQPNLWLGSLRASQDSEALAERGVTHVLSVGECNLGARQRMRLQPTEADPLERLLVAVPDESSSRLDRHFTACSSFISEGLKNGGSVLVHCFAGQSRSPTLVAAHLMCVEGWTAAVALEFVQRRRPSVHPNAGFLSQLLSLEGRLRIEGRLGVKAVFLEQPLSLQSCSMLSVFWHSYCHAHTCALCAGKLHRSCTSLENGSLHFQPADRKLEREVQEEPRDAKKPEEAKDPEPEEKSRKVEDPIEAEKTNQREETAESKYTALPVAEEPCFDPFGAGDSRARCQRLFAARSKHLHTVPGLLGLAAPLRRRRLS
ncbi:unnamed protein product [Polarella glacialis]|uniref:Protein-serine/threonine phosphatase n=1 Tax=Polarella glacialis TaxID=89957 RepID=A0A813IQK2_POLGL|nr:unnamed protein product [Polarella glacialis]